MNEELRKGGCTKEFKADEFLSPKNKRKRKKLVARKGVRYIEMPVPQTDTGR